MNRPLEEELRRLYRMGLALHWLHPRSKRPVAGKWTSGPRFNFDQLKAKHEKGQNVGVRLGQVSKVGQGFLAVVDCDVKSDQPKHREEMEKALSDLFPRLPLDSPRVTSGRGNGSGHIYCVTTLPASPKRLAQSTEKVRVKMPSAPPSKFEEQTMTPADIKAGWRFRPAWEISQMGEGQQVVLPPSVHPDTNQRYKWEFPLTDGNVLPLLELEATVPTTRPRPELARNGDFKPCPIDLICSGLPSSIVDMILTGDGCTDKSAGLFKAAIAMCKERFTDDEILTALTDPDTVLGQASFDHANTTSRGRAAEWVYKYTLLKAREETDAVRDFAQQVEVAAVLGDEAAKAQLTELVEASGWQARIERDKMGRPKPTLHNTLLILRGEFSKDLFRKNEFSGRQIYGVETPWGGTVGREITDDHLAKIKEWFADHYRFEPGNDKLADAITAIAWDNAFHPVRDYLDTLEWDGVCRIDTWMKDYWGAKAKEPYLSAVSRKILCAMVARVYKPGCKFDHVLILEGLQGVGKSTAVRSLVPNDDWFTDARIDVSDKDGMMAMRSAWVIEVGELSSMRKADVDQLKEFITRTTDRYRAPYGRRPEDFPRQCIFIGTTNRRNYLQDPTGNRRFWPVDVGLVTLKSIAAVREQLLAEAKFAVELGEPLYLEDQGAAQAAMEEQSFRTEEDTWVDKLRDFFEAEEKKEEGARFNTEHFRMSDLFLDDFGALRGAKDDLHNQRRAAAALRSLGYQDSRRRENGVQIRYWEKDLGF